MKTGKISIQEIFFLSLLVLFLLLGFSHAQQVLIADVSATTKNAFQAVISSPNNSIIYYVSITPGIMTNPNIADTSILNVFKTVSGQPFDINPANPYSNLTIPSNVSNGGQISLVSDAITYIDPVSGRQMALFGIGFAYVAIVDLENTQLGTSFMLLSNSSTVVTSVALQSPTSAIVLLGAQSTPCQIVTVDLVYRNISSTFTCPAAVTIQSYGRSTYDPSSQTLFAFVNGNAPPGGFGYFLMSFSMQTKTYQLLQFPFSVELFDTVCSTMMLRSDLNSLFILNGKMLSRLSLSDFGATQSPYPVTSSAPAVLLQAVDPIRNIIYTATYSFSSQVVVLTCGDLNTGNPAPSVPLCSPFNFSAPYQASSMIYSPAKQMLYIVMPTMQIVGISATDNNTLISFAVVGTMSPLPGWITQTEHLGVPMPLTLDADLNHLIIVTFIGNLVVIDMNTFPAPSSLLLQFNIPSLWIPYTSSQLQSWFSNILSLGNYTFVTQCGPPAPCTSFQITYGTTRLLNNSFQPNISTVLSQCMNVFNDGYMYVDMFGYDPIHRKLVLGSSIGMVLVVSPQETNCSNGIAITPPGMAMDDYMTSMAVDPLSHSVFVGLQPQPLPLVSDLAPNIAKFDLLTGQFKGLISLNTTFGILFPSFTFSSNTSTFFPYVIVGPWPTVKIYTQNVTLLQNYLYNTPSLIVTAGPQNTVYDIPGSGSLGWMPPPASYLRPFLMVLSSSSALSNQGVASGAVLFYNPTSLQFIQSSANFDLLTAADSLQGPTMSMNFLAAPYSTNSYFPFDLIVSANNFDYAGGFMTKFVTSCPAGTSAGPGTDCSVCSEGSSSPFGTYCSACISGLTSNYPAALSYCPVATAIPLLPPDSYLQLPNVFNLPLDPSSLDAEKERILVIIIGSFFAFLAVLAIGVWRTRAKKSFTAFTWLRKLDAYSLNHYTAVGASVTRQFSTFGGLTTLISIAICLALLAFDAISYQRFNNISSSQIQQGAPNVMNNYLTITARILGMPGSACADLKASNTFKTDLKNIVEVPAQFSFSSTPQTEYQGYPAVMCLAQWTCNNCLMKAGVLQSVYIRTGDMRGLAAYVEFEIIGSSFSGTVTGTILPPTNSILRGTAQPSIVETLFRQNVFHHYNQPDVVTVIPSQIQVQTGSSYSSFDLLYLDDSTVQASGSASTSTGTNQGFALQFDLTLDTSVSTVAVTQRLSFFEFGSLFLAQATTVFAIGRFLLPTSESMMRKFSKSKPDPTPNASSLESENGSELAMPSTYNQPLLNSE